MGTHSWKNGAGVTLGLSVLLLLLASAPIRAQDLSGIVVDRASKHPVKGADVLLVQATGDTIARTTSAANGRFRLKIPDLGAYAVKVGALGYGTFTSRVFLADSSQDVSATVSLAPAPVALEGLTVTAKALDRELTKVGFYEREKQGFGHFVTPKEIERRTVNRITDAFYGIPGVQVRRVGSTGAVPRWDVTVRGADSQYLCGGGGAGCGSVAAGTSRTCYPSVYVDGDIIRHGGNGLVQEQNAGTWTEMVSPRDVAAIEVYTSAAGLPAFAVGSDSPCGTVLIWTKGR